MDQPSLGIALSGGGHRATVFGLGALLYLADVGLNRHVKQIVSVSGGSILNAFVARLDRPFNAASADDFERDAARLARLIAGDPTRWGVIVGIAFVVLTALSIALAGQLIRESTFVVSLAATLLALVFLGPRSGGSLWCWWGTWLYFALLVWSAATGIILWGNGAHSWVILAVMIAAWGAVIGQRHLIAGLAYRHSICRGPIRSDGTGASEPITLESMHSSTRHVFCATEMHAGHHAFFSHDLVYSAGFGLGEPGSLPLDTAVQVSANFPGGFPLRPIRAKRFRFDLTDRWPLRWIRPVSSLWWPIYRLPKWMVLTDGGVFDNLADAWHMEASSRADRLEEQMNERMLAQEDQWLTGMRKGHGLGDDREAMERFPKELEEFRKASGNRHAVLKRQIDAMRATPDRLIVVDAGTSVPWQSLGRVWLPFLGELGGFVRVSSVMYNNTTAGRARDLEIRFAARQPEGALVDMSKAPIHLSPRNEEERAGDSRVQKCARASEWETISDLPHTSRRVRTTLLPLGTSVTAQLLYHGYLQTMASLHVSFGYPLIDPLPPLQDFERLARGLTRKHRCDRP